MERKVQWAIYYERKKAEILSVQKSYRTRNQEHLKQAWINWYAENRVSQIEKAAMRRKKVISATPHWLSDFQRKQITDIYFLSITKTEETGVHHQVDHIVPVSGKTVCGLHVPWNLRVITRLDNIRKSNKLDHELATA